MKTIKILLMLAGLIFSGGGIAAQDLVWRVLPGQMPYPVGGCKAVVIDSLIYIVGGYSESAPQNMDIIQIYNPQSNTWSQQFPKMSSRRRGFTAERYLGGILILGGIDSLNQNASGLEFFEPRFMQGTRILHRDINFNRISATGKIYGNSLFLFGGNTTGAAGDSIHRPFMVEFNFLTKSITYTNEAVFNGMLAYQQMSALVNDEIYLFGGIINTITRKVYKFNTQTKKFEASDPSLLSIRAGGEAVYDGMGRVYVIGGYNETKALSSVDVYTTGGGQASVAAGPQLNHARKNLAAVEYNGSIYVFGGFDSYSRSIGTVEKLDKVTSVDVEGKTPLSSYRLFDNYPNPFNAGTVIKFTLPEKSFVTLDVYTVLGEHVASLAKEDFSKGEHSVHWNGTDKSGLQARSGIYVYRLKAGGYSLSKKMVLLK